jgi:hypothetical protein
MFWPSTWLFSKKLALEPIWVAQGCPKPKFIIQQMVLAVHSIKIY